MGLNTPRKGASSRLSGTYNNGRPKSGMSTDVLDKRPERFTTQQKDFTPRTLRTKAQSRLSQSKNYNPPKRKEKRETKPRAEEDAYSSFSEEDIVLPPQDQTGLVLMIL